MPSTLLPLEVRETGGLTFNQWADSLCIQIGLADVEKPGPDWRAWASRLRLSQDYHIDQVPDPHQFQDWRSWADSFNQILTSSGR